MSKERILKGAEELFFRYGIKTITMDDIAKHLGMSKKTIYHFFSDKDEVVNTLMKDKLKEDEKEVKCIFDAATNIIDEVFGMMKHMSVMFSNINPVIFYDLQKYYPEAWKLFQDFKSDFILTMVEKSLTKGIKEGHVRNDINPKILSRLRMQEVEMGFNSTIFPPDKFKMVDVQLAMTDHFLHGICTLKGHRLINKYKQIVEEE